MRTHIYMCIYVYAYLAWEPTITMRETSTASTNADLKLHRVDASEGMESMFPLPRNMPTTPLQDCGWRKSLSSTLGRLAKALQNTYF